MFKEPCEFGVDARFSRMSNEELDAFIRAKLDEIKLIEGTCGGDSGVREPGAQNIAPEGLRRTARPIARDLSYSQDIFTANLVVEHIEAVSKFREHAP